jgi:hypothetical protein
MNRQQLRRRYVAQFSLLLAAIAIAATQSASGAPLVTAIAQNGTLVNTQPAIATSNASPLPQPAGGGTQGSLGDESWAYVTRTGEWTAVRTTDATGLLTNSVAAGTTLQAFPSYLVGLEYLQVAQEHRTAVNYSVDLTFSQDVRAYLFIDNRVNGTLANNSNPNTVDPILTNKLAWVGIDGWTRVNTSFMPNGQADYLGQDEGATVVSADLRTHTGGGNVAGSGNGLNNFSAIFTKLFTAGLNVGVGKTYEVNNSNMYGMAFAAVPEPTTTALGLIGICAALRIRRKSR